MQRPGASASGAEAPVASAARIDAATAFSSHCLGGASDRVCGYVPQVVVAPTALQKSWKVKPQATVSKLPLMVEPEMVMV